MIGKYKTTKQIEDSRREQLKNKIDEIGRKEFSSYIGENYYSLSQKLTKHARLTEVYAVFLDVMIKEYKRENNA